MLTTEQLAARKGKLTASRIACLMAGERDKIMSLYLELTGQAAEEDLTNVWAVQLGAATEKPNLDWYERKNRSPVGRRGEVVVHPALPWAAATLDGWDETLKCPIETKHVGGREPLEVVIDRYQPQMQWQMACTKARQCALSVIVGANEPVVEYIPADADYQHEMVVRGTLFMEHVTNRTLPVQLDPIAPPVDATRIYDMTGNNRWASSADHWLRTKVVADTCRDAEKILKSIVPEDAKRCFGHGIQITRDRAGRLSLREVK